MRSNPRMIIVMRADLKMRKGKCVAQGSHAVLGAYKKALCHYMENPYPAFEEWDNGEFTKICVVVNSEEELLKIAQAASDAGLNNCVITDAGHTEFHGVPTITCMAIGPAYPDELAHITG